MMMDSQRQSLVSFDRSTSPTSPISSESEDEVFLSGKVATSPAVSYSLHNQYTMLYYQSKLFHYRELRIQKSKDKSF